MFGNWKKLSGKLTMTVNDLIAKLQELPKEKRSLPTYISTEYGYEEVGSASLIDVDFRREGILISDCSSQSERS
jgi:hypothetical protein